MSNPLILRLGRRFFGWSRDFRGGASGLAGRVALYLFRGGYCGLSRVEGGAFNLAGVISEKVKSTTSGWEAVLLRARAENSALDRDLAGLEPGPVGFLGTGPVFFTAKPAAEQGVLMAGDAAGVLARSFRRLLRRLIRRFAIPNARRLLRVA